MMSWDLDAMSVLPEETQQEIHDNFSPEFLAEKLSDRIVELESRKISPQFIKELLSEFDFGIKGIDSIRVKTYRTKANDDIVEYSGYVSDKLAKLLQALKESREGLDA